MYQQIKQAELLKGRTIEKVVGYEDDNVWILLEGGFFAIIQPLEGYCDESPVAQVRSKTPEFSSRWPDIGICTPDEAQVLDALSIFDYVKAYKMRERRQYERLKRMFERTDHSTNYFHRDLGPLFTD